MKEEIKTKHPLKISHKWLHNCQPNSLEFQEIIWGLSMAILEKKLKAWHYHHIKTYWDFMFCLFKQDLWETSIYFGFKYLMNGADVGNNKQGTFILYQKKMQNICKTLQIILWNLCDVCLWNLLWVYWFTGIYFQELEKRILSN